MKLKFKFAFLILLLIQCQIFKQNTACKDIMDCFQQAFNQLIRDREDIDHKYNKSMQNLDNAIKDVNNALQNISNIYDTQLENLNKYTDEEIVKITAQNENRNHMYREATIYDDIILALDLKIIKKIGNPVGWDDQTYRTTLYCNRKMMNIGSQSQQNENGIAIEINEGEKVLWVRTLDDVYNVYRFQYLDGEKETLIKISTGNRHLNEICPDGSTGDSGSNCHQWFPVPIPRPGVLIIMSDSNTNHWISGIALGQNPWNHAKNNARAYYDAINGGGNNIGWASDNFNNDVIAYFSIGQISEVMVPVIPSGKDKLVYFVEYNSNSNGGPHYSVTVNGQLIERFRTSYQNPFATHYNSKYYDRYFAARIPKEIIQNNSQLISLKLSMITQNSPIYFREIGTHDYN